MAYVGVCERLTHLHELGAVGLPRGGLLANHHRRLRADQGDKLVLEGGDVRRVDEERFRDRVLVAEERDHRRGVESHRGAGRSGPDLGGDVRLGDEGLRQPRLRSLRGERAGVDLVLELPALVVDAMVGDDRRDEAEPVGWGSATQNERVS